jgi:hypothetical protein
VDAPFSTLSSDARLSQPLRDGRLASQDPPAADVIEQLNARAAQSLQAWKEQLDELTAKEVNAAGAAKQAAADEERIKRRYWWNFGFLLVLVALVWLLFLRHLEHIFAQTLFIGLPITAWTAWQIVRDWTPSGPMTEGSRALSQRILRHRHAMEWLIVGIVVLVAANLTTSSIYVTHRGGSSPPAEVELWAGTQKLRENLRVSAAEPVRGQPEFLQLQRMWSPVELQMLAGKPLGYELKPDVARQTLRPWSRVRVAFPSDFQRVDYYIVRVTPGTGLQPLSPKIADEKSALKLEIWIDDAKAAETDMSFDCFYFGASGRALSLVRAEEPPSDRLAKLRRTLTAAGLKGLELQDKAESLAASNRFVETPVLRPHAKVFIIVRGKTKSRTSRTVEIKPVEKDKPYVIQDLVAEFEQ